MIRRFRLVLALACSLSAPAWAGFDEGVAAYKRGDYEAAFRVWRRLAEQGVAGAPALLGYIYQSGWGVAQDYAEAVKWYRLAAEQGHARGQYGLGLMYANGWGVAQDRTEAVKWFRLAAEQGEAAAQFSLGVMYENGWGVAQDYVQAHQWLNLSAARPRPGEGRGIVAKGREMAAKARDDIERKMAPAQVAEAQRLAREWMTTHGGQ